MPRIFVSYSREDSRWVRPGDKSIDKPLVPWLASALEDLGVELWFDHALDKMPGDDYEKVICAEIDRADFALLLLSQDFILSKFIRRVELPRIRTRIERGELQMIPILVASIDWTWNDEARWLQSRHVIPGKPTPLNEYTQNESDWKRVRTEIAASIRDRVRAWQRAQSAPPPKQAPVPSAAVAVEATSAPGGLPPARPGEASDDQLRALAEAEARLAAAKARQAERLSSRAAREREAEIRRQLEALEEEERRLAHEEEEAERQYQIANRKPGTLRTLDLGDGFTMNFCWIPAGTFTMGSPNSEAGRSDNEGPQREVTISRGFWMGQTPVTQAQWKKVMGTDPSHFKGADRPVECVSWDDCAAFLGKLSLYHGETLRFPTEAEWEYACRAGTKTPWFFGNAASALAEYAWFADNAGGETKPVGKKKPNPWGLLDIYGNVWEWCADWLLPYLQDPQPSKGGQQQQQQQQQLIRGFRGGGWDQTAVRCRSACRGSSYHTYGNSYPSRDGLGLRPVLVA